MLFQMSFSVLDRRCRFNKLDITERRAVWYTLHDQWNSEAVDYQQKQHWKDRFKSALDECSYRELVGGIIPLDQIRNSVYEVQYILIIRSAPSF